MWFGVRGFSASFSLVGSVFVVHSLVARGLVQVRFGWFGVHGFSPSFSSVGSVVCGSSFSLVGSVVRGSSFSSVGSVLVGLVHVLVRYRFQFGWFGG